MTKRQRRLTGLAIAVVLFLGPIAIMGNCSGWNEGSMKVAACTVPFPGAASLASLFYGVLLLSAFLVGLPILAYLVVCGVLMSLVRRFLMKRVMYLIATTLAAAVLLLLAIEVGKGVMGANT